MSLPTRTSAARSVDRSLGKIAAIGSGLLCLFLAASALVFGEPSQQGAASILLLVLASISLAVALGVQAVTYGRASRYATAMPEILRLGERLWRTDPTVLTPTQATALCDEAVDALAKIFEHISGHRCHVSIEIVTPGREGVRWALRRSTDYLVVNLSRDLASDDLAHEDHHPHAVQANSPYREIFLDPACAAVFFREDVAADPEYASSESKAERLSQRRRGDPWPLHYRSTLVVKICNAERCAARDHTPVAFLWLRSPEPGAFDERYDVELMQRMSRAVAPIVTRCVRATTPTFDFRRQPAVVP